MWQDYLIAAGGLVLIAGLLPTVVSREKPPILTSATLAGVLFAYAFTYGTMSLWFAAVTIGLQAALWATVAVQKWRQNRAAYGSSTHPSGTTSLGGDTDEV